MRSKSRGFGFLLLAIFMVAWMGTAWTWMMIAGNLHHAGVEVIPAFGFGEAFWMVSPLMAGAVLLSLVKVAISDL